ncbi:Regulatory protein BlaR1 [Anatilimnocola aggregata]|uniref:Regulatory protein BlaR1 n=1 Tax=Anatilimnocola aggregata TaxID=2528021 RepID=A0A517Y4J0_9BACT|nr:M56 family metallopeptidase [Anatilimnocola aggregata]QDU25171.1 Regulatory protein BlaR1 [Anatilimnocola aggregata]
MTAIDLLTHPFAQRLTWTLAHFLWQGALIAALLVAIVEAFRIRNLNTRYALSLAALVAMLLAVPATWLLLGEMPVVEIAPLAIRTNTSGVVATAFAQNSAAATNAPAYLIWCQRLQPVLFTVWLAGCLLLNLRLVVSWLAMHALLRSRLRLPREVTANLARLGWRLKTSIPHVVYASERVTEALAVGFFRPVVLLPAAWLLELPPNLLEAVVAHELAHLRRCDLWVNLLQRLAEAVLFYHPAVWWLSSRLRRERELCCDQLAVAATGERLDYAEALELTARWAMVDGRPALAAGFFGEGQMNLLHRVRCVLGISSERPASLWPAGLVLGGLSLALLAAIYGASGSAAVAQEGAKPAEVKREGDAPRREGEVRREGDRPREGEVRRDGDRPRPEGTRDGDRPRPEGAREGDRPRPEGAREGDRPRPEGAREGDRRPANPASPGEQNEMMQIIRQLRAEVTELRAEVARLRGGRGPDVRRPGSEGDIRIEPRRDGDRPRVEGERRDGDRPRPEGSRPDAPRPEGTRPPATREGGDRPKVEGERREGADRPKTEGERR